LKEERQLLKEIEEIEAQTVDEICLARKEEERLEESDIEERLQDLSLDVSEGTEKIIEMSQDKSVTHS
jgi:hypothetical protein